MGEIVKNVKNSIDINISKKSEENQSFSSKSSSSESSESNHDLTSTNFSPTKPNPDFSNSTKLPPNPIITIAEPSNNSSHSSSSSSSLSDTPAEGLKIKIESEDQDFNKFSLSSPILKPAPKSREFSEKDRNPPKFDFEFISKDLEGKDSENEEVFSDEDTVNDLQMLDDAFAPVKREEPGFNYEEIREDYEKDELDKAVVMENSLDGSSSSSCSSNEEILKEIKEPEKFTPSDLYHHQVDSPGIVEQAVSYLPSDLIEEKMNQERVKGKKQEKNEEVYGVKGKNHDDHGKNHENKGKSEEKGKDQHDVKNSTTEKKMIKNSLTESKTYEKNNKEDPKGSSVCSKCLIL
jgi:hypothetical protein